MGTPRPWSCPGQGMPPPREALGPAQHHETLPHPRDPGRQNGAVVTVQTSSGTGPAWSPPPNFAAHSMLQFPHLTALVGGVLETPWQSGWARLLQGHLVSGLL